MEQIRVVIWGTGEYSYKIAQKMKDVNDQLHSLFQMDLFDLIACLDSNKERTNDQHLGVKVVQPQYFFEQEYTENQLIIVAIKNHRSVFEWLAAHDYLRSNIITYDKFWYKGENLSYLLNIILQMLDSKVTGVNSHKTSTLETLDKITNLKKELGDAYNPIKTVLAYELADELVNGARDLLENSAIKNYLPEIVEGIANYYFESVDKAEERFQDLSALLWDAPKMEYNNLAIYYPRYYNGGVERVISYIMPMFVSLGYNVFLIVEEENELDFKLPDGAHKKVLNNRLWDNEEAYRELYDYFIDHRIGTFLCHSTYDPQFYYVTKMLQMVNVRVLGETHTNHHYFENSDRPMEFYSLMYSTVDELIVLSTEDVNFWAEKGIRATYIPNFVQDFDTLGSNTAPRRKEEKNTILWVGRIDQKEKKVYETVDILGKVKEEIPDIKLYIVGKADQPAIEENLKGMFAERGLTSNVVFEGYSQHIEEYMLTKSIFFMTSHMDGCEGFPMVLGEAMRYGIPIVMYKLPYLEVQKENREIITVENDNWEELSREIIKLLKDNGRRHRMTDYYYECYEKMFDESIVNRWKTALEG